MNIYDDTQCSLGEGPLWHPERGSLFWFDIIGKKLFERAPSDSEAKVWQFDEYHSAAAWVDQNTLLLASASGLWRFDIESGAKEKLVELEADNPVTRSNDGRADTYGGFWIGTMGINAEQNAGAIYRYYKGELRQLYKDITISNAICFSPDGQLAYFCDTTQKQIMQVNLDAEGWPMGEAEVFLDLREEGLNPDGAVVDANGNFWNAQWGSSRVACYSPKGEFLEAVSFPSPHTSCPAFGGENLTTLFATTAREGLEGDELNGAGLVYQSELTIKGQKESRVTL